MIDDSNHEAIDRFVKVLRRRILSGELPGGARLGQQEIAAEFQLSRHHVREIIRILSEERLIVTRANASAVVAPLSMIDYEEVHELHLALEPMLGRLAVPNLTGAHLLRLEELIGAMENTTDTTRFLDAHDRFHTLIYRQSQRPWMIAIVDQSRQLARRYLNVLHTDSEWREREIPHRLILNAVQTRDPQQVENLLADHMREAHDRVFRQLLRTGIDSIESSWSPGISGDLIHNSERTFP